MCICTTHESYYYLSSVEYIPLDMLTVLRVDMQRPTITSGAQVQDNMIWGWQTHCVPGQNHRQVLNSSIYSRFHTSIHSMNNAKLLVLLLLLLVQSSPNPRYMQIIKRSIRRANCYFPQSGSEQIAVCIYLIRQSFYIFNNGGRIRIINVNLRADLIVF